MNPPQVYMCSPEGWYGEGGGRRVQDGEHMEFLLNNEVHTQKKFAETFFLVKFKKPKSYINSASQT